jgi:hypothetical protein
MTARGVFWFIAFLALISNNQDVAIFCFLIGLAFPSAEEERRRARRRQYWQGPL